MTLNDVRMFVVGILKQSFKNKKTLDKFDDTTGTLKYNGVPVNNVPVFVADDSPVGNIISFMGNTAPKDYLICDGSIYNIADYPLLTQHFIAEFGSVNYFGGDGETTFAVPDLRGEFLRGTGTATRDTGSGAEVGEHQDPTRHIDIMKDNNDYLYIKGNANQSVSSSYYDKKFISTKTGVTLFNESSEWSGSGEIHFSSRPTNTSVLYCIKYQITQNNMSKDMVNYSLEEQVIGSWINGKPVYQKTFLLDTPTKADTSTKIADLTELNIEYIVSFNGRIFDEDTGNGAPLNGFLGFDANWRATTWINNTSIYQSLGSTFVNNKLTKTNIYIQYTKTTDAENSFTPDMLSSIKNLNTTASNEEVMQILGGIDYGNSN